ncbi:hypothetical protein JCM6882_003320 [Rhodosporidiobolus microsporus]
MVSLVPPTARRLGCLASVVLTSSAAAVAPPNPPRQHVLSSDRMQKRTQRVARQLYAGVGAARRTSVKRRRTDDEGDLQGGITAQRRARAAGGGAEASAELSSTTPGQSTRSHTPLAVHLTPSPTSPRSAPSRGPQRVSLPYRPRASLQASSSSAYALLPPQSRVEARTYFTFRSTKSASNAGADTKQAQAAPSPSSSSPPPVFSNSPAATSQNERAPTEKAAAGGKGEEQRPWPPKRSSSPGPRPSSPYGEINALVRHPTLYDPVLKPRFPIVLCHGLYGFDVRGPGFFRLHYWGDLLKILRGKIGAEVFVTAVPGTGSVKKRAHVLHKALDETQALLNRDVNFLAHSMGGLDARYLISNIRPTLYRPRSLTTVCTPHRGSEFMAWCRANIGIGTEFDSNEALNLRPSISSSLDEPDDASIPLPYSLKSPILSREQVEAAKKAAQAEETAKKVKAAASILPFNLSTSVTSYLLELLDSPAYANLTPSFLRDVFNPSTPDRDDVKYYSIAARADKIPIWHPLWLPKLVLDGAESARVAQGVAAPPEWRGNDGLVSLDSARWGEFLGTFDHSDHWEMRGSSGLSSAEASKHAVEQVTQSEIRDTKEPKEGEKAQKVAGEGKKDDKGWQWQDVYASVAGLVGARNGPDSQKEAKKDDAASPPAPAKEEKKDEHHSDDAQGLASAASWIIRQLPGTSVGSDVPSSSTSAKDTAPPSSSGPLSTISDAASSVSTSVSSAATSAASTVKDNVVNNRAARLLYGAPGLSSTASAEGGDKAEQHLSSAYKPPKDEKFSLERMSVALCRKLYNDGF